MPAPRILIFANPIAGRGKGKILAKKIERELSAQGFTGRTFFDRPADVPQSLLQDPAQAVISIGGDGTLRSVVNLFYAHRSDGPAILPVPMGTANLMGQHLGIRWSNRATPRAVIDTIRQNKIVRLDAGRANGHLFLLMAGVGIDAQIVHLLDSVRRGPIDMTSYLWPMAMTFAAYTFPPITVTVDDHTLLSNTPAIALIGNVREYGIGIPILTDAIANDGLLDICIMPCRNRTELIELIVQIAIGEHARRESVTYTRGKSIRIEAAEKVAVQVDGDSAGFTPLAIDVLPALVPFLVPV
jgi:diacylglycerol kinase (ATP)